ncbi:30S ribosomal protein S5 [Aurantiacibacter zhengii]|uniref:Small ribosomal subunit protein uS5 n=1 Tax=Aurantiacibacter zhengii TaxID=2307003 RepID=A0A418NX53_9SPHN|nr:30S ribosomal protein S5 [Aurantiacibacter zhengii]RIV89194.1 30S ribosomal protein S5 [Aurantiacibacter zhengii]
MMADENKNEDTGAETSTAETPEAAAAKAESQVNENIDGSTPTPSLATTEAADNQSAAGGDEGRPRQRGGRGGNRDDNRGGGRDGGRGRGRGRDDRRGNRGDDDGEELIEKLVHINRVAKVVKGGKRFGFAALVVVGDGKGRVGFGHGKAREVPEAINKATAAAKKKMIRVPLKEGRTLHHDGKGHFGAGKVNVRSAPAGTGIIAGGPMRAVFESLGVADVVTKSIGTSNPYNMIRATFDALVNQSSPKSVAQRRGKKVADLLGRGGQVSEAEAQAEAEAITE